MSHNIETSVYNENVDKKKVQRYWDDYAAREDYQEGCSGLNSDIRWIDHICDNEEDAEKYIQEHDSGWYDQLAVKFKDYGNIKPSKALQDLQKRIKEIEDKLTKTENKVHYKDVKSAFVSCKKCNSKLSTKYINSNFCPMCREDLRPTSTLDTIQGYKDKKKELRIKMKEEELKLQKKMEKSATIKWLVKIEYHT